MYTQGGKEGPAYEGERYDCLEACRHCSAEELVSGRMLLCFHDPPGQLLVAEAQVVARGNQRRRRDGFEKV